MKTNTLKSAVAFLIVVLCMQTTIAQEYPCTIIDVKGSRYGDSMWLFTVEGTTDGYDNGWDGLKMFGSTLAPQMWALSSCDRKLQVYTSSNVNGVEIGFRPGEDTNYTFTFRHHYLSNGYQELYLFDKVAMKTIDIYAERSTYSFTCNPGDLEQRFTIIALTESVQEDQNDETVEDVTEVVQVPVIEPVDNTDNSTDVGKGNNGKGNSNNKGNNKKELKAFVADSHLIVDNPYDKKGKVKVYNARNGRMVKQYNVDANSITTIPVDEPSGTYVINVEVEQEETISTRVIM